MVKWWIHPDGYASTLSRDEDHDDFFREDEYESEDDVFQHVIEAIQEGWVAVERRSASEVSIGGTVAGIERHKDRILELGGPALGTVDVFIHDRDLTFKVTAKEFFEVSTGRLTFQQKMIMGRRRPEWRPVHVRPYRRRR